MDDGKRLGVYAERLGVYAGRLGVAFHCAPATPPEDRRGGVAGRTRPGGSGTGNEAERLEAFWGSCFRSFLHFCCVDFLIVFGSF